jgi:glycosyltransferase involved in cell wall biosynthesis
MISIIIPSYNSENTIKKCLDSLLNQSYGGEYEIILVDSSIDKTPQIVSSQYQNVKFIHLDKKTDPGSARNLGIEKAKGAIIAFIDSDCIASNDWLEKLVSAHKSTSYNIIGGVVNNGNAEDDLVGLAGYISEFRDFLPGSPKQTVKHIPTCNISYKIKIFHKFGKFQGKYYPQEDLVFNHTIFQGGEKILMDPEIQVYHHHRSILKDYVGHQNKIGAITSKVLKMIKLEGSFIACNPGITIMLFPVLPAVKFARTIAIFLRYQPNAILKRPLVVFLFIYGLISWNIGFVRGVFEKNNREL